MGIDTIKDLNDSVAYSYEYENALLHGLLIQYDSDGDISYQVQYENGERHDLETTYTSDGSYGLLYCNQNDLRTKTATESQRDEYSINPSIFALSLGLGYVHFRSSLKRTRFF